jgi:hypothetical protein
MPNKRKGIAPDSVAGWLNDGQGNGGGKGCVNGIAPLCQHSQTGLGS